MFEKLHLKQNVVEDCETSLIIRLIARPSEIPVYTGPSPSRQAQRGCQLSQPSLLNNQHRRKAAGFAHSRIKLSPKERLNLLKPSDSRQSTIAVTKEIADRRLILDESSECYSAVS